MDNFFSDPFDEPPAKKTKKCVEKETVVAKFDLEMPNFEIELPSVDEYFSTETTSAEEAGKFIGAALRPLLELFLNHRK